MTHHHSLANVQSELLEGNFTCKSLVEQYLQKISELKHLNAFLEVFDEESIAKAEAIDQKISAGDQLGRLFGLVISVKDNISYKGHKTSASSKILSDFECIYSATAVERLLLEDAIIIGRTNCDEFGMGSSNENSAFGPVLNPIREEFVPGGSSGGAAVSVAAGMCMAALASDTGGSIRQPASFCGIVGLKPGYGKVSRFGLIAYASSFDQIGPLSNNPQDAARILEVIQGYDPKDATSSAFVDEHDYDNLQFEGKARIAYFEDGIANEGLDPDMKKQMDLEIKNLKDAGHAVESVDFPYLEYLIPSYYVLTTAEASSNLARFDGVHFGHRAEISDNLDKMYTQSRSEGFGHEVKNRIMLGTFVLSSGYYDAYYSKAQKVRRLIRDYIFGILADYDFIMMPTSPGSAFKLGEKTADPVEMYLSDIYTVMASLCGVPAISLPLFSDDHNMPMGLQLMANKFEEHKLLSFSDWRMNLSK